LIFSKLISSFLKVVMGPKAIFEEYQLNLKIETPKRNRPGSDSCQEAGKIMQDIRNLGSTMILDIFLAGS
jgi:hypothetical protein